MSREIYKNYVIEANPQQLADDNRWTVNVNIERHEDDRVKERPYSASNTFETKEEAVQYSEVDPIVWTKFRPFLDGVAG